MMMDKTGDISFQFNCKLGRILTGSGDKVETIRSLILDFPEAQLVTGGTPVAYRDSTR